MEMKKKVLFLMVLLLPAWSIAQTSYQVGVVNDYRFRGVTQTDKDLAVQGVLTISSQEGFYGGFFVSTSSWVRDLGGKSANIEVSPFAGFKTYIPNMGAVLDFGATHYIFPSSKLSINPDTTEAHLGLHFTAGDLAGLKLTASRNLGTNFFAFNEARKTMHLIGSYEFDFGQGSSLILSYGKQNIKGPSKSASYNYGVVEYIQKLNDRLNFTMAYSKTNAKKVYWQNRGDSSLSLGLQYTSF